MYSGNKYTKAAVAMGCTGLGFWVLNFISILPLFFLSYGYTGDFPPIMVNTAVLPGLCGLMCLGSGIAVFLAKKRGETNWTSGLGLFLVNVLIIVGICGFGLFIFLR